MAGGFSFCGVDISTIGLEYAPELEDTYVYKAAKARIHEETFDGHDGGYFYGTSKEPKEFNLRCIFEEKQIDKGIIADVMALFKEGRSGKLIFDRRPWCYYYATVTELNLSEFTNYLNGIITITMKAYYPYARSEMFYAPRTHKDYYRISTNTAFMEHEKMIPPVSFCEDEPITETTELLLLNPGNEYASVGIEIAGDTGKGVTITNLTTNQTCGFVAMSEAEFDGEKNYIYLDGLNGKTISVKDGVKKNAFLYHDEGFIELYPAFPLRRNVNAAALNNEIIIFNKLYDRHSGETREETDELLRGQHIYLNGQWHEIKSVGQEYDPEDRQAYLDGRYKNEHRLIPVDTIEDCAPERTVICQLNHIIIKPVSTMKLTRLNFIYSPTFS